MADVDLSLLTAWVREFARVIGENAQLLTDLDAAIGDADHGINMDRGMTAVLELGSAEETAPADMAALCKQVGMTLVKSVGGASGPLYGTFFLRMAKTSSNTRSTRTISLGRASMAHPFWQVGCESTVPCLSRSVYQMDKAELRGRQRTSSRLDAVRVRVGNGG